MGLTSPDVTKESQDGQDICPSTAQHGVAIKRVMQADQTVLSLRPGGGGGGNRGSRFLGPRFDAPSSDLPLLRPHGGAPPISLKGIDLRSEVQERLHYTRDQLLQLRQIVDVPEAILKIKREIEAQFFGEEQIWGRGDATMPSQPQGRYAEPDNRDWRGRSAQLPTTGERGHGMYIGTPFVEISSAKE
ncbi:Eukaryotic translation initiation factor isoform 4G-1 [Acorus calamus]|uniref:Eukaryotic translation initiation factor isoform 4G-1 n=1 Tax=Acorus calamus TaxID=4465 RepID=A0AAV9EQ22_ACOCL|nr:Eukaryotic translation initiation factor isoform 4G-1 [Acorus calamus]